MFTSEEKENHLQVAFFLSLCYHLTQRNRIICKSDLFNKKNPEQLLLSFLSLQLHPSIFFYQLLSLVPVSSSHSARGSRGVHPGQVNPSQNHKDTPEKTHTCMVRTNSTQRFDPPVFLLRRNSSTNHISTCCPLQQLQHHRKLKRGFNPYRKKIKMVELLQLH